MFRHVSYLGEGIEFDEVTLERWSGGRRYLLRLRDVGFKYDRPGIDALAATLRQTLDCHPQGGAFTLTLGETPYTFRFTRGAVEQLESVIRKLTVEFPCRAGEAAAVWTGGQS